MSLELEPKAAAAGYSLLVARFDGSNWRVYRQDDSELWHSWPNLDIDAEGRILLATSQGLLEFRQSEWRIVQEGSFAGISVAPDGTIWLVGDGLFRLPSTRATA